MVLSCEHVIKYSFYIVIILYKYDELIYYLNISLKSFNNKFSIDLHHMPIIFHFLILRIRINILIYHMFYQFIQ